MAIHSGGKGAVQGDTLAPLLFVIAFDIAMRIASSNPQETGFPLSNSRSSRLKPLKSETTCSTAKLKPDSESTGHRCGPSAKVEL